MEIDWGVVVFEILNFGILAAILSRFLFKPVRRTLTRRREEIEALREEMGEREVEVAKMRERYEGELARLEEAAATKLAEATHEARDRAEQIVSEARAEGHRLIEAMRQESHELRQLALVQFREELFWLAVDAAGRIIRELGAPEVTLGFARRAAHALDDALGGRLPEGPLNVFVSDDVDPDDVARTIREALAEHVELKIELDPMLVAGVRIEAEGFEVESSAGATLAEWHARVLASEDGTAGLTDDEDLGLTA